MGWVVRAERERETLDRGGPNLPLSCPTRTCTSLWVACAPSAHPLSLSLSPQPLPSLAPPAIRSPLALARRAMSAATTGPNFTRVRLSSLSLASPRLAPSPSARPDALPSLCCLPPASRSSSSARAGPASRPCSTSSLPSSPTGSASRSRVRPASAPLAGSPLEPFAPHLPRALPPARCPPPSTPLANSPPPRGPSSRKPPDTTRAPRAGELNGVAYHFVPRPAFDQLVADDAFIEHAQFSGNCYGTSAKAVKDFEGSGKRCLLDIDTQVRPRRAHLGPPLGRERVALTRLSRTPPPLPSSSTTQPPRASSSSRPTTRPSTQSSSSSPLPPSPRSRTASRAGGPRSIPPSLPPLALAADPLPPFANRPRNP